jgi:hypothetical protein
VQLEGRQVNIRILTEKVDKASQCREALQKVSQGIIISIDAQLTHSK